MNSPQPKVLKGHEAAKTVDIGITAQVDPNLLMDFPANIARQFGVIPLYMVGSYLVLASKDHLLPHQLEELSRHLGVTIHAIPCHVPGFAVVLESLFTKPEPGRKIEEFNQDYQKQNTRFKTLGEILCELGLLSGEELPENLAIQLRDYDLDPSVYIDRRVLDLMPEPFARRHNVLPLGKTDGNMMIATTQQLSPAALAEIRALSALTPRPVILENDEALNAAIDDCYSRRQQFGLQQMRLGKLLLSTGLVNEQLLEACLLEQKKTREDLIDLLIKRGHVAEDEIYACPKDLRCEFRRFKTTDIDLELSNLIPQKFAEWHLVLPLRLVAEVLEVALADPTDLKVMDMLGTVASAKGYTLKPLLSVPRLIRQGIDYAYKFRDLINETVDVESVAEPLEESRPELALSNDMPAIRRILNKVLYMAVMEGASDVHIENLEAEVRVRFRVDGILHARGIPITKENIQKIISLLKIDAGLDITEHRRAQDGSFKKRIDKNRFLDFRINAHATEFGEDAVIRILDGSRNLTALDKLDFPAAMSGRYLDFVENPQGLILFTGPTGSGKSTTLYSTLSYLNRGDKKIVTAEDPVEYYVNGICQYQVNEAIGNSFAELARRFLRKDPDIILIGEIRDEETAEACLRAALTGHLVFSTLHTNNTIGVIQRLRDLGVESSSIGEALLAVVGQRLARRVCNECRTSYQPDAELLSHFYEVTPPEPKNYEQGIGCPACNSTGYRGRVALYEFWDLSTESRQAIAAGSSERLVSEIAYRSGLMPLLKDGLRKVHEGITTLEELRRVVPLDEIRRYWDSKQYQHALHS